MHRRSIRQPIVVATFLLAMATGGVAEEPAAGEGTERSECLADEIGPLRAGGGITDCAESTAACKDACAKGDDASCLGAAYAIESDETRRPEVVDLYARGCRLGRANACTNYGAGIWARDHTDEQLECALRLFTKACAARGKFACGMVARVLMEGPADPALRERARGDLEAACAELGGFSCRVLAKHLEAGDFGSYPPDRIATLLERACASGDPDACGDPATAAETFR